MRWPSLRTRPCPQCKKLISYSSYSGDGTKWPLTLSYVCQNCGIQWDSVATKREAASLRKYDDFHERRCISIHRLYHKFRDRFMREVPTEKVKRGKKTLQLYDEKWKYDGWEMMKRVRRLEGRPGWEGLHVLSCDDTYHASSSIVLIEHRDGRYYWGTTVLVVTQCDGQPLKEFFLYGSHLEALLPVLLRIQKLHRATKEDA